MSPRLPRLGPGRARRARAAAAQRYATWVAEVEPGLAARPRVHRFADPPVIGEAGSPAEPLCVCIIGAPGADAGATLASIQRQTVPPAAVLHGEGAEALGEVGTERAVLVRAGDGLAPNALHRLGQAAGLAPDAALITCDDDALDAAGARVDPHCKPGPSPDLLLERDHAGVLLTVQRDAALAADAVPGPVWPYELALRLTGPDGARAAHCPAVVGRRTGRERRGDGVAELEAVRRVLTQREPGAGVTGLEGRRTVTRPVAGEPAVEVIVAFRDRPDLLARCVRPLLAPGAWERLRVRLVDNASTDPALAALLAELARDPRVVVESDPRPFNFSRLNNAAAATSEADVLLFLNNDVEPTPGAAWMESLLGHAQRPEAGAVAPVLTFPSGRVQHAGAALGLHGWAGHPFAHTRPEEPTPFGRATDGTRNWLAVSAACLMVQRSKFAGVGGFDEDFTVTGNDVDLCLRLTAAGHRSLCVPHVRLVHDESATRDPQAIPASDYARSRERYGAFRTVGDPFYNPNLTLAGSECAMRGPAERDPV